MKPRLIFILCIGLAGTAVLLSLGYWQVQRLAWKESVLSEIDTRIQAAPESLPSVPDPEVDRYLPVLVTGTTGEPEMLVQSSLKSVGPGFRVVVPFETSAGRRILLDRGFIRLSDRDKDRDTVTISVEGNLHWPDEKDRFIPDPDLEANLWFARDLGAMAQATGTEPILVVARRTDENPLVVTPLPIDSAGIPNNHLEYAITWFLLAVVWLGMTVFFIASQGRREKEP